VGGLAYHFEKAGIATTQISLVRPHTERARPPRALWVPFDLGRPFGPPDNADFQRRVVAAALELLDAENGPVLSDFPEDEPATRGEQTGWACPINFTKPQEPLTGAAKIAAVLRAEIAQFAPWYDRAIAKRGRTTVGGSGLELDALADLFARMLDDELPDSPSPVLSLADAVRLGAEDLKAYYIEAASAQPGNAGPRQLADWFWRETAAADVFRRMKTRCLASDDEAIKLLGIVFLVPTTHAG
jgi:hypothetical protein